MTEAKHTPGPWRIGSKCEERGRTWIGGSDENGSSVLPYLACINWPDHQDANARLIAAAPEMLEALRGLVAEHLPEAKAHYEYLIAEGDHAQIEQAESDLKKWENARAAISKAEARNA